MTYRCTDCEFLSDKKENPKCTTPHNCSFERVETIHYASPSGTGRVVGQSQITSSGETEQEVVNVPIKLHCSNQAPFAPFTSSAGVTCVKCLKTIQVQEEINNGSDQE